nr:ribosomal protein L32 [Chaetopeltis orbicularis]
MAVPKKRTSKSKKNIRKNAWKKKVLKQATRALLLAKYGISTLDQSNSDTNSSEKDIITTQDNNG